MIKMVFKYLYFLLLGHLFLSAFADIFDDPETLLDRQEQFLQLTEGLFDLATLPQSLLDILEAFNPLESLHLFPNPETVLRYFEGARSGKYLSRDESFNRFHPPSLVQAIELFEILFFAPDWDTFYKTAIAAREISNPEQFFYSLLTAAMHRDDSVEIPPLYEIAPEMFLPGKEPGRLGKKTGKCKKEQQFSKFYNDPRLKSHIMMQNMRWPSWWDDDRYGKELPRRGEQFWYMTNQLISRLDMERDAIGLPPLKPLDWKEFDVSRDAKANRHIAEVLAYESRLQDAIKKGYVVDGKENKLVNLNDTSGVETLMTNINGRPNTLNPSFNDLGHQTLQLLKSSKQREQLEGLSTVDSFRYYKRMDNILRQHKHALPPYTRNELAADGIKINYIKAPDVLTTSKNILAKSGRQKRQNLGEIFEGGEPLCIEVGVTTENNTDAEIRIFGIRELYEREYQGVVYCGPEDDRLPQCQPRETYLDMRTYQLRLDTNNNTLYFNPLEDLYNRTGIQTGCSFDPYPQPIIIPEENVSESKIYPTSLDDPNYLPSGLKLPKGNATGVPIKLFIIATALDQNTKNHASKESSRKPLGFPFDRKIVDKSVFNQKNMIYKDIKLIHYE